MLRRKVKPAEVRRRSELNDTNAAPEREAPPAGIVQRLTPRVRRLVAPNPSAFTFTGTCSYIVGEGEVAVIDPGPDNDAHLAALIAATRGETVAAIVITHTHRDHSPLARRLKEATGAPIVGARPHVFIEGPQQGLDASHDRDYAPDRILSEGDEISVSGLTLAGDRDAGTRGQSSGFCLRAGERAVQRRSCDGLVDLGRRAA